MKVSTITVYLPDSRGVEISPYGSGNLKIGMGVFTYSRLPGDPSQPAVGNRRKPTDQVDRLFRPLGTCPGATLECQAICYAARPVAEQGVIYDLWYKNSCTETVPPIPADCRVLRLHISGDFTSEDYIRGWITRLTERPDVTCWAYTRSWRVAHLLPALEELRALPNMQLFASMDPSTPDMPPAGWRRSWILRETEHDGWPVESRLLVQRRQLEVTTHLDASRKFVPGKEVSTKVISDGTPSLICPEETGQKANCVECGYCFEGKKHDVTFLEH